MTLADWEARARAWRMLAKALYREIEELEFDLDKAESDVSHLLALINGDLDEIDIEEKVRR